MLLMGGDFSLYRNLGEPKRCAAENGSLLSVVHRGTHHELMANKRRSCRDFDDQPDSLQLFTVGFITLKFCGKDFAEGFVT